MAYLRIAEEKTLSKAVSALFGVLRVCITHVGTGSPEAASAVIDMWSDVDPSFSQYPYPVSTNVGGCFDLIQRFIFPALNEWIAVYWAAVVAGTPASETLATTFDIDKLQQSFKTGVSGMAQNAATVGQGLAVAKIDGGHPQTGDILSPGARLRQ